MFNFKFKLILRKKKIYVNCFFLNFQLPMLVESVEPVLPVESVEEIILKNPPKSPFKKGGLSVDSKDFPPFVKGGVRGDFALVCGGLDSGYPPSADSVMTGTKKGGVYPRLIQFLALSV
jgi:hypothetical protein